MKAAARKLRMAAGPATSIAAPEPSRRPVPMEPPTATMAICPAVSWWRSPSSLRGSGEVAGEGMLHHIKNGLACLRAGLAPQSSGRRDPSFRLKNGCTQDDAAFLALTVTFVIVRVRYRIAAVEAHS